MALTKSRSLGRLLLQSGWPLVVLLWFVQVVGYVDRMLPILLIEQLKRSLAISDFQVGLLLGPAFATLYILAAIPCGLLVDRWSPLKLLALAVLFWSMMTGLASVATNFNMLFVSRLGIGLAEACLAPCALAVIPEAVSPKSRFRAIAFFQTGSTVGMFVAVSGGGWLVTQLASMSRVSLPFHGALEVWQELFLFSALLGIPMALLLAISRDPKPRQEAHAVAQRGEPALDVAKVRLVPFSKANAFPIACLLLGGIGYTAYGNIGNWNIALFAREWGWEAGMAGPVIGFVTVAGAIFGAVVAVPLARPAKAGGALQPFKSMLVGLVIGAIALCVYPLLPDPRLALVLIFFMVAGMGAAVTAAMAALGLAVPSEIRGSVTAIYFFCCNLIGMVVLQPVVGAISDRTQLSTTMSAGGAVFGVLSVAAVFAGRGAFQRMVEANTERNEDGGDTVRAAHA